MNIFKKQKTILALLIITISLFSAYKTYAQTLNPLQEFSLKVFCTFSYCEDKKVNQEEKKGLNIAERVALKTFCSLNDCSQKNKTKKQIIETFSGKNGQKGHDGIDGIDGRNGVRGPRGFRGIQGLQGEKGKQGSQGPRGRGGRGRRGSDGKDATGSDALIVDGVTAIYSTEDRVECVTDGYILKWDSVNAYWSCFDPATISAIQTLTSITAHIDGTFSYLDEQGNTTIIDVKNLETLTTLTALGSVLTYTDEDGIASVIDIKNLETLTTLGGLLAGGNQVGTFTDEDGVSFNIFETVTGISTAGQTFTYTAEDGTTTSIDITTLETVSTLVNNADKTFTYTNEDGTTTIIDFKAEETTTTILDNGNGTFTYTNEDGVAVIINISNLETTTHLSVDIPAQTISYINEDGLTTVANIKDLETTTDISLSGSIISYKDEDGVTTAIDIKDAETTTTFTTLGQNIVYTDEDGTATSIDIADLETLTTLVQNADGTLTYVNEDGVSTSVSAKTFLNGTGDINLVGTGSQADPYVVSFTETHTTFAGLSGSGNTIATYTNENGDTFIIRETTSTLVDNGNQTFTYTNEEGLAVTLDGKDLETLTSVSSAGSVLTYIDEDGVSTHIDIKDLETTVMVSNLLATGNQIAKLTNEDGTSFNIFETITSLVLNANSLDFIAENGLTTNIDLSGYLDNTDNQTLSLVGTVLSLVGGNTQDLASIVDWNNLLNIPADIADGDDDTQLTETQVDAYANNNGYLSSEVDGSISNETISGANSSFNTGTNILTIQEAGIDYTFDLSNLNNSGSDDQQLQSATLAGTNLTITLEDGGSQVVNLASLVNDADASATNELNTSFIITAGNSLDINDAGGTKSVDLSPYLDNTDNQNLTGATLTGNSLKIDIESGNSITVDLTSLVNDADFSITNEIQDLSLVANSLKITNNGGATTIDLSPYLDNTDNQKIDSFTLIANTLSISAENDGQAPKTVSLSAYLDNTDDQKINLATDIITLSNGTGANTNVDISAYIKNTESINELADVDTNTTAPIANQVLAWNGTHWVPQNATVNTDTQDLSIIGHTISLVDGGSVVVPDNNTTYSAGNGINLTGTVFSADITAACSGTDKLRWNGNNFVCATDLVLTEAQVDTYVSNNGYLTSETDDQNIFGSSFTSNNLTIGIENGNNQTISLAGIQASWNNLLNIPADIADGDDDTQLTETQVDAYANNNGYLTSEVDGSVSNELQDLTFASNILSLTNSATNFNLSAYLDNTDQQDLTLTGNILAISNDPNTNVNLSTYLDNTDTLASLGCGPNKIVQWDGTNWICVNDNNGTDDQNLSAATINASNILTLGIENGAAVNVNLSQLEHTGTAGSVFFAGSDTKPTEDNTNLFWDNLNNRLGVGTTNPQQSLEVIGAIRSGISNATTGTTILEGRYSGNNIISTLGSFRGSGATTLGYAVRPDNAAPGYISSANNVNFQRSALEVGNGLRYKATAGAVSIPIGDSVPAMTELFTIEPGGNIGVGDSTPDAKLDVAGSLRLDGTFADKDGDVGTVGQILSSTAIGTDWVTNLSNPIPFISSDSLDAGVSVANTITLEGVNFTPTTAISIPGFGGVINSVNILSPTEIEITITPNATVTNYDIVVSNGGVLNTLWAGNGVGILHIKNVLIPGNGTTNWVKINNATTSLGKLVPGSNATGWSKGAGFGTVPASTDFLLEFNPAYMTGYSASGYAMIGMDNSDPNWNYNTIDYAIYLVNGSSLNIYENGGSKGSFGTWTVSDTFGLRRTGTTIDYLKNGSVFYTSLTASNATMVFDTSLYRYLGAENIKITY